MFIKRFLRASYIVSCIIFAVYLFNIKEDFLIWNNDDVFFQLYIPRINISKWVYTIDSKNNFVDYNIELLKGSDEALNLYFLASHSGGGSGSYFDDLVYLEIGDIIWIYKFSNRLCYVIDNIFYIDKTGYFEACYSSNGGMLYLITCSLEYPNRQLVVSARLVYSE